MVGVWNLTNGNGRGFGDGESYLLNNQLQHDL